MQMSAADARVQEVLAYEGGAVYTVTANSTLYLREGPGTGYKVLGDLCRGELVVGVHREGGWVQVIAPARQHIMGWASARWLR